MYLITVKLTLLYTVIKCIASSKTVRSKESVTKRSFEDEEGPFGLFQNKIIQLITEFTECRVIDANLLFNITSSQQGLGIVEMASDEYEKNFIDKRTKKQYFIEQPGGDTTETTYIAAVQMDSIDFQKNEPPQRQCLHNILPRWVDNECTTMNKLRTRMGVIQLLRKELNISTVQMFSPAYFLMLELVILHNIAGIQTLLVLSRREKAYFKKRVLNPANSKILEFLELHPLSSPRQPEELRTQIFTILQSARNMIEAVNTQCLGVIGKARLSISEQIGASSVFLAKFEEFSCNFISSIIKGSPIKLCRAGKTITHGEIDANLLRTLLDFHQMLLFFRSIRDEVENNAEMILLQFGLKALLTKDVPIPPKYVKPIIAGILQVRKQQKVARVVAARNLENTLILASESVNLTNLIKERPFLLCSLFYKTIDLIQQKYDILNGCVDDSNENQQHNPCNTTKSKRYIRFITETDNLNSVCLVIWMDGLFRLCREVHESNLDYGTCSTRHTDVTTSERLLENFYDTYNILMMMFPVISPETLSDPDDDTVSVIVRKFNDLMDNVLCFVRLNASRGEEPQNMTVGKLDTHFFIRFTTNLSKRLSLHAEVLEGDNVLSSKERKNTNANPLLSQI